ncbi:inward rectifier potassium channel 2-like [Colias croceus]|uniref:inward rectifier potassium channel 2-like n=1 Tax=Colias crocea TaxID=72248 RepID=UPI001E27AE57|nr:inward rectifier potassium channel 2-like [Colias croceus]
MDTNSKENNVDELHAQCSCKRHIHKRISFRLRQQERIVFKSGELNFAKSHKNKLRFIIDLVKVLLEARWRWTILYCTITCVLSWLIFAVIWWVILYLHGDLEDEHLPLAKNITEWKPCVTEIYNFTSIFLFSIEVQTSIGYGSRAITLECPEAMFTMCIESITGKIIQSLFIGIVFAKLTKPKNRAQTLMFSKYAIINQRDGYLCLMFRVGNTRKSRIIASTVNAYLIKYITKDGVDLLNYDQVKLNIMVDNCDDVLFIFPVTAVHRIDENSPFYDISAQEILKSNIEILVTFEGTIESTGQPLQAKSSYTGTEILWGRRFIEPYFYKNNKQGFVIDFCKFDETYRVNTPLCTGQELINYYRNRKLRKIPFNSQYTSTNTF